jgi:hypothetical protein
MTEVVSITIGSAVIKFNCYQPALARHYLSKGLTVCKIESGFLMQCTTASTTLPPPPPHPPSKPSRHLQYGLVGIVPNQNILYFTLTDRCRQMDERGVVIGAVCEESLSLLKQIERSVVVDRKSGRPYRPDQVRVSLISVDGLAIYESKSDEEVRASSVSSASAAPTHPDHSDDKWDREQRLRLQVLGDTARIASSSATTRTAFIARLSLHTHHADLHSIFSRFGTVTDCRVVDKPGHARIAFITFAEREECDEAVRRMDGVIVDDCRIRVDYAHSARANEN